MALDKIYTLQTGVSLKVSTDNLQDLIIRDNNGKVLPSLEKVRCTSDLYDFLTVIVLKGADGLITRRQQWISKKNRANLIAAQPVPFQDFCLFFWRNLDETDPDGDEWNRIIATDSFNQQLSTLLHKLRAAINKKSHEPTLMENLNFSSV